MTQLTVEGNTRPSRNLLKSRGWQWSPAMQCWVRTLESAADVKLAIAADDTFLRGLKAKLMGCLVRVDGREVWRSKSYAGGSIQADRRDADVYDCDEAGNFCAGNRIAGSMDRI